MQTVERAVLDTDFLGVRADLFMQAGRDRAADAIYAAIEAEATPAPRAVLRLVHSAEPA